MEMFIRFHHILRTPKRLQAAVSNRSAGGKTPPFTLLLASSCRFRRHFYQIYEFYDLTRWNR
jgi:hypothetical protein